jgi:hypothetical protein
MNKSDTRSLLQGVVELLDNANGREKVTQILTQLYRFVQYYLLFLVPLIKKTNINSKVVVYLEAIRGLMSLCRGVFIT